MITLNVDLFKSTLEQQYFLKIFEQIVIYSFELKGQTGILGHQTRESALACLENCPLLENMAEWSQWSLVFEPQLGKLRDFVQKYGGCQNWPLEGTSV